MSNLDKAVELISNAELPGRTLHPLQVEAIALLLKEAGLLAPDVQAIRTPEELEALAREDANAVVLAGFAGVPRIACTLYEMHKAGQRWTLPAVIIATGKQVREAREAMEVINE